jgi:hypothetical protein
MGGCRHCRKRYARNLAQYLAATPTPVSRSTAAETTPAASTTPVAGSTAAPPTMPLALVEIKKEVVETAPVPAPLKVGFQLILVLKNQELLFNY